ncbi:peptide/nickel transport system ATP-binding protein [Arthrobacter pigmenti]|uniref:Peptide/nickel transport system ATP-binding protein n=1 Tax=Arthrobacter pigmenti TaxID=271432 RepID=A0A846RLK1_9MICC|nr:ABC transporter ATP-binding protein [Arthrobacter pigmenti]NJC21522.1 peptide/nickel transport system ATP-binding protein [Arthrobacter pigmenti]
MTETSAPAASVPEDRPVLDVRDVSVTFTVGGRDVAATRNVNFSVYPGEILAIVGESGSGKSVSAMSVLDLLPRTATRRGTIELNGMDTSGFSEKQLRQMRGGDVAMIFQEPMTALNPVFTIGWQISEILRLHTSLSRKAAKARAVELLDMVGIPDPKTRVNYYPHQLSGGQRQRTMIAMAISCDPKVLIADEPTTALDVTVQAEILDLLRDLRHRVSSVMVLITHDMGVVADIADRVIVMKDGEIVEEAPVHQLFAAPAHPYTQQLLAAVPHLGHRPASGRLLESVAQAEPESGAAPKVGDGGPILQLEDVVVDYPGRMGRSAFRAVDSVSLQLERGGVLGLVGESGSGKSTLGRVVVGLQPVTSGRVVVSGLDITSASRSRLRPLRRRLGMVFQDPASSLNPRYTIGDCISEPLRLHRLVRSRKALDERVMELLENVELPPSWRQRFPHELSGGQRQRVAIARALAAEPELLVADEPTSALDVSVQARLLDLLMDLQARLQFSCLFISHDLAVVELLADRIAVMNRGVVVEQGSRDQVLRHPEHPYTRQLLAAAPVPDPAEQRRRRAQLASTSPEIN